VDHGGDIKVESRLGEGTTFKVILPTFKADEETTDAITP
jgi:signal transduction histidine kinase